MWERLGHQPTVALAGWPTAIEEFLVEDSVTCIVQVQGKVRGKLEVPPTIDEATLQELAMSEPNVVRAIGDATVRNVIVRAPKVVNIVIG
jgi:leucyl-tRNA synthetase